MCNNNHWNIAQIVPDCQLKTRPVQGQQEKLKAEWQSENGGGVESAEQALIKAASDRNCQVVALVEATIMRTAHRGGTEVDWEENHWLSQQTKKRNMEPRGEEVPHWNEGKGESCGCIGPALPLKNLQKIKL